MDRVGDHRQAARQDAADDLCHRQPKVDDHRPENPRVAGIGVYVMMMACHAVVLSVG